MDEIGLLIQLADAGLVSSRTLARRLGVVGAPPQPVACPKCGAAGPVLNDTKAYPHTTVTASGKTAYSAGPRCPVAGFDDPPMTWSLSCGCQVHALTAAAFSAEVARRENGGDPKPVTVSREAKDAEMRRLRGTLSRLYSMQAVVVCQPTRAIVDYWVVVVADQMMRLGEAPAPAGLPVVPAVADWAAGGGYAVPDPLQVSLDVTRQHGPVTIGGAQVDERPVIARTRNGQFSVRFGNEYKVFLTEPEARRYARALTDQVTDVGEIFQPAQVGRAQEPIRVTSPADDVPTDVVAPQPEVDAFVRKRRTIRRVPLD